MRREQFAGLNQHYKRFSYDYYLDVMERLGFTTLELWAGPPHFLLDEVTYGDCLRFRWRAHERGMHYAALTAPSMLWPYNYCSVRKEEFDRSLRYFSNGVRAAAELGCRVMVVNSGFDRTGRPFEEGLEASADMLHRLAELAQREGVTLAAETLQPFETGLVTGIPEMKQLLEMADHPNLKVMIDLVAANVAGETAKNWFDTFGKDVVHSHFIDGDPSGHKVFGEGTISLPDTLAAFEEVGYEGVCSFELGPWYNADPERAEKKNLNAVLAASHGCGSGQ